MPSNSTLTIRFAQWFAGIMDNLVRSEMHRQPMAKAFALSAYADAESGGEGEIFVRALRRADDPRMTRMIARHEADEVRHAQMFRDRLQQLGLPALPIPDHLKTIHVLSDEAGGVLDLPMDSDDDIVAVYQLLLVIEERAMVEFGIAAQTVEALHDSGTAALFREIARDERRHLAYCRAVGRHYAGSDEAFEAGLERMAILEARVYAVQSRLFLEHMLDMGYLKLTGLKGLLVRGAMALTRTRKLDVLSAVTARELLMAA